MNDSLWKPDFKMLEVGLNEPDHFLKVRGNTFSHSCCDKKNKTLFRSCHILHKQGKILHCSF